MKMLSVIIPCYNEEEAIPLFYKEIKKISNRLKKLNFEFIFVNDGSRDNTLGVIKKLIKKDKRVRYIDFSRNFGKEAAMMAGLEASRGDFVTIMDADLQDPPELLPEMYRLIVEDEYDCVTTRRVNRKGEPPIRSFFAKIFYNLVNKISKVEMVQGVRDYRLMKRVVVDSILRLQEYNRFSRGIFGFVGFKTKLLEFENIERVAGETKWSFWKLFLYAIDGFCSFSTTPLVISALIGFLFCIISFTMILVIIVKTLMFGDPVGGWPSLVCIIFMVSGIQLFCMGIMGEYMAKTYLEVKNRPIYIVRECSDLDE